MRKVHNKITKAFEAFKQLYYLKKKKFFYKYYNRI